MTKILFVCPWQDADLREKPLKNEDIPSYSEFEPEFTTLLRQMRAKL